MNDDAELAAASRCAFVVRARGAPAQRQHREALKKPSVWRGSMRKAEARRRSELSDSDDEDFRLLPAEAMPTCCAAARSAEVAA